MYKHLAVAFLFTNLVACGAPPKKEPPPTKAPTPAPTNEAPKSEAASVPEKPAQPTAGPVEIVPPLPPKAGDDLIALGWSKDGKEFGFCAVSEGTGQDTHYCEFLTPGSDKPRSLSENTDSGELTPEVETMRSQAKERGYSAEVVSWPYASEMVLAWETNNEPKKISLKVGIQTREGKGTEYGATFTGEEENNSVSPAAIALSPDGKSLGVVVRFGSPEQDAGAAPGDEPNMMETPDQFKLKIFSIEELVDKARKNAPKK